jgi:muramoyltetrapeptide carboxypeptidase
LEKIFKTMSSSIPANLESALRSRFKAIELLASSGRIYDIQAFNLAIDRLSSVLNIDGQDCISNPHQRFAGTDQQRLNDIEKIAKLDQPSLVLGVRGGYGLSRLIHNIDYTNIVDALKKSQSVICGHSDLTTFQVSILAWCHRKGIAPPQLWQGPMLCADFGMDNLNTMMCQSLASIIESELNKHPFIINWTSREVTLENTSLVKINQNFDQTVEGVVWGGNLSMITHLIGTPFMPLFDNGILIIEDVNEHPYRVERMLWQLIHSGVMQRQKAVIFAKFTAWKSVELDHGYNLDDVMYTVSQVSDAVVFEGFPFGHIAEKITWPQGMVAKLSSKKQSDGVVACQLFWNLS